VDGLQRFCAIAHFVDVAAMNKALNLKLDPMRLTKLESLTEYDEKAFLELPRPLRRRINETELTLHIIRASTPDEVKFNIFSRINRGGLPLTAQEIRNAVYRGEWRNRVKTLAESERFLDATDHKIKGERMEDLELVLRFVAHFTLKSNQKRPDKQNLDTFLNETIKERSVNWGQDEWTIIESSFFRALEYAPKIFDRIAFRKYSPPGAARRPINRGLFETETVVLAQRSVEELRKLSNKSEFIIKRFNDIFEKDADFRNALLYATGRGRSSSKRIETINKLLDEALRA